MPNFSKFFIVTLNYIFIVPVLITLVTSRPSFLYNSSVGETYSAGFPVIIPKKSDKYELLIGVKT